ncbi:Uncharacterized phage protein gp47/JayE [Noviherbaspirillum humi]|uniref:Uncharacterized phage protein gp47/JayE n=1 Tax=Noviherbaspirillum humi TaxID=1688639 RepID=A0A239LEM4_9BURK|nr:baseplate J/gp47 family protein [Noviherbaspirillum humi]SNT29087.1 Uncharacterized phage protein gp47/JayE [Noviherbaspirillum humi]
MPFNRPTLQTLIDRALADMNSRLPEGDSRLAASVLNVLAYVNGGAASGLYGYLDWLSAQLMIDTCEQEYLDRWAGIWGVTRTAAAPATGNVTLTGSAGATVPAGSLLQRADGQQFRTSADVTLSAGTGTAAVTSIASGAAANTAAGVVLVLVSPVVGVNSSASVATGGLSGAADAEADDALRSRLLARIQTPPHGGSSNDYLSWSLEVAGVTRAWVYPQELGAGTVTVRFVRDNDTSLIPDAGEVATVQAYLDARRPVTAQVTVAAPIADTLNFQIQAVSPNTAAVQAAIQAELADLLLREATPGGTLYLSHIRAAISAAAGEANHVLVSPSADVVSATGHMPVMGAITWL